MVLPVPVVEMLTLFPLTGLSLASSRVTVTVSPAVLSTEIELGETAIVDLLADTAPGTNMTMAVLVRGKLSVVSVAEMIFVSAFVDLIVAVV